MILLVVQRERLVMNLQIKGDHFYKRVYDTELQAEVELHKRGIVQP